VAGFISRFEHREEQDAVSRCHLTNEIEVADGSAAVGGPGQAIGQPENRLAPILVLIRAGDLVSSISGHVHC